MGRTRCFPGRRFRCSGANFLASTARSLRRRFNLNVTAPFRHLYGVAQENDFGITLGDIVPTLTGERE